MQTNNFLSLLYCFNVNGQYKTFPLFADIDVANIIAIRQKTVPNAAGVFVPAFIVYAQNPKSVLAYNEYWCTISGFETNLTVLYNLINSQNLGNAFTFYTGLKTFWYPFDAVGDLNGAVICNDAWTINRYFSVTEYVTYLNMNVINGLTYMQITVNGDQTLSGEYYYYYYAGH